MAIKLGWYGTRGQGGTTEEDMDAMANTGLTSYVSYGLWNQSWAQWKTDADAVIQQLKDSDADDVNLIMELSEHAWADISNKMDDINGWYDSEARVAGYYVDEPNLPAKNITDGMVQQAAGILDKPLYVMIRPSGGKDPADPDKTPVEDADQSTYNGYAEDCDKIAGFWYPMGGSSSPEWTDIEEIQATSGQSASLYFATNNNQSKPAWFAVQSAPTGNQREPKQAVQDVPDTGYDGKRFSAEWFWMVHKAIYHRCEGILFYNNYDASDNFKAAVHDMCRDLINYESANRALETTPLATNESQDADDEVVFLEPSGAPNILWSYHYFSDSYWLLVIDENAESDSGKPRRLEFKVNLHDRFNDFVVLNNRYNIWQSQGRGLSLATTNPGGNWKQHDTLSNFDDRKLGQGQVFLYRYILS